MIPSKQDTRHKSHIHTVIKTIHKSNKEASVLWSYYCYKAQLRFNIIQISLLQYWLLRFSLLQQIGVMMNHKYRCNNKPTPPITITVVWTFRSKQFKGFQTILSDKQTEALVKLQSFQITVLLAGYSVW